MGMSSTVANIGSVLNSGLLQPGAQPGPGDVSIGLPYGPGYTQPNLYGQPSGPGDVSIGMPAGPGYMQPSSGGGKNMPAPMPIQGNQPMFNLPNPVQGPGDLTGQIGMPAGPGFMQPTPLPTPKAGPQTTPLPSAKPLMNPQPVAPNLGTPQIGMPAGPGFMNPGGIAGSIKGYPTSPAAQFNTMSPIDRQMQHQKFNQPTQPPVAQFNPAATMTPLQRQALAQKATQQAAKTVGLRTNPKQPMTVYKPRGY